MLIYIEVQYSSLLRFSKKGVFCLQFNNKVTRTISLVPFAVLIGSPVHVLWVAYCWLWRPHCICLEQNSIGMRPKVFEARSFPCCILNNTNFFGNQSLKSKKIHDVKKSEDVSKRNGVCKKYLFTMRIMYTKLQSYSLCYRQTKWYMQKLPSVTGIMCVKCQNCNICM